MKFLQAAVLSVICVGYISASGLDYVGYDGLRRAIDEGNLDIAVELVKQDETLVEEGVKHVIRKDDPDLIANFVNQTNQADVGTLYTLWRKSPRETFERILEKINFLQEDLVDFAASHNVFYHPEKFPVLLNKIVKPEDQEKAVEKGFVNLVDRDYAISPLLNALKGQTFRSKRLEHFAIQKVFMAGATLTRLGILPDDIFNHAAITPELYANALILTAEWGKDHRVRILLLKHADLYDLEAVKEKAGYADLDPEFCSAIKEALKTAAPGGTRQHKYLLVQSAKIAKETFDEITGKEFPEITDITGSFLTGRPSTRERAKAVRQTIGEVTKTRTPLPTKEIGDILNDYVGEDEE